MLYKVNLSIEGLILLPTNLKNRQQSVGSICFHLSYYCANITLMPPVITDMPIMKKNQKSYSAKDWYHWDIQEDDNIL